MTPQEPVINISGGSRPSDKGGTGHPDPEIGGARPKKKRYFRLFGPQFGLRKGGSGPSPESATECIPPQESIIYAFL